MSEKTVRVRMRDGMTMPLPPEIVRNSSVFVCTPETPIEVLLNHRFTRRRLQDGDFVLADEDPATLGLPEGTQFDDSAPFELREDRQPQEPDAEKRGFFGSLLHGNKE